LNFLYPFLDVNNTKTSAKNSTRKHLDGEPVFLSNNRLLFAEN
jgi:hypothetical protein